MMHSALPRSSSAGFSLIELMLVILVVAVLTILAVPNFSNWLQNSRTRSVAESRQNGLRFAQGEAARRNRFTTFTPSGTGWSVAYTQNAGDSGSATLQTAADSTLGNVVAISPTSAVSFNSFGRAGTIAAGNFSEADKTYQITNTKGNRRLNVVISSGGKVRMCDPDKTYAADTPDGC